MQVLWNSKVKFVSVSQLLGLLALWSLFGSDSGPLTVLGLIISLGEKKEEIRKKKSLLLTWNRPEKFCWSQWLQQAKGGWDCFCPFQWFSEDGDQVWAALFTVAQPPAQFLSSLLGPQCPSAPGWLLQSSSCAVLDVPQLGATHIPHSHSLLSQVLGTLKISSG